METPLQIFNQGIQNHSIHSVSGRSFVLTRRLKSWLNSTVDSLRPQTVLESLYNTIVSIEVSGHLITPPWKSDSVLIFCILLELGLAHLLEGFTTNGTSDKSLPIDERDLCALTQNLGHEDDSLADRFFEIQWRYCAAVVDLDGIYEWQQGMVIPICFQNLIAEGRTAKVYEIAVPEDFIGQRLANDFPHCRRYLDSDLNICPGWYYRFALKTFDKWNTDLGKREMAIFRGIDSHEGFVRPLAAFQSPQIQSCGAVQTSDEWKESYNILFECCEMDLGYYLASKNSPITPTDIELFWTNVSKVTEALRQLHGACQDIGVKTETSVEYFGYHHDIKPSNILLSEGQFKLSDFGFASFGPINEAKISAPASFGTVSYGPPAPNIYTTTDQTHEGFQKFDLWSLGCVLSEAATWVILGYPGIKTFSTLRRQSLDKLCSEDKNEEPEIQANRRVNIPRRGDYFHDGSNVLAIVTSWHRFLRSSVRRSDMITTKVLDIIDRGLLVSDIKKRLDANTLCVRLKLVISEGEREGCLLPSIDTDLEEFLREEWSKDAEEDVSGEYY